MKALIHYNKIIISPYPVLGGMRLWVRLKKALNEYSEPLCYTEIYPTQKTYDLPCPCSNILGLYITKRIVV